MCIHGFGGNADQFRKNIPVFADNGHPSYAIDLLGYGKLHRYFSVVYHIKFTVGFLPIISATYNEFLLFAQNTLN